MSTVDAAMTWFKADLHKCINSLKMADTAESIVRPHNQVLVQSAYEYTVCPLALSL